MIRDTFMQANFILEKYDEIWALTEYLYLNRDSFPESSFIIFISLSLSFLLSWYIFLRLSLFMS